PQHAARTNYGWRMQMLGDKCYVVAVQPGSDADAKGVKAGDQLLVINGFAPVRENLWKLRYMFNVLRPQPSLQLKLAGTDGGVRQMGVAAKVTPGKKLMDLTRSSDVNDLLREYESDDHYNRHRTVEMGEDVFIWKMPAFDLSEQEVDSMMGKVKKRGALI